VSGPLVAWLVAAVAVILMVRAARARRMLDIRMDGVATACHELRGALAAMGLVLARMEDPVRPATWRETVAALRAQQARAVVATEDLEALQAGDSERSMEARCFVDVEALVRRSVRSWAAAHGRWRVVLDWRAGRPAVFGQAGRLGQVLDNLIANALEHGAGRVTVVGRVTRSAVTVSVLDLGDGLRQSLKEARPLSRRSRRGHGLAIVRRAVEDHGGEVRLVHESKGTGVQISLPLAPESPSPSDANAVHPAPGPSGVARTA
jgi:signal transduction histidine kinase